MELTPQTGAPGQPDTYLLTGDAGQAVRLSCLGASLLSWLAPDRSGELGQVVLGFPDAARYQGEHPSFGATVGRFANRIGGARLSLDQSVYALSANDGPNHIHGGPQGFARQMFSASPWQRGDEAGVVFERTSLDGEEGYPGNLAVRVSYRFGATGRLSIDFQCTTDAPTVVNLTHHGYFNLQDGGRSSVADHRLWINASRALRVDAAGLPTGEIEAVAGTLLDFRKVRPLGPGLTGLRTRQGYDHCYLLDPTPSDAPGLEPERGPHVAHVFAPGSGRSLDVWATQPALQLYTANFLDGSLVGHQGVAYGQHSALCLETQHCPDTPNRPQFGSVRLDPGGVYAQRVVYELGLQEA